MKKNKDNNKLETINFIQDEDIEDVTKYGEFISSYFAWIGLKKQKEIVERIENITKKR